MPSSPPASQSTTEVVTRKDYLYALLASFLGWTLDAFDFFVVVFVMRHLAQEFHTGIPAIAATITATLACRPVGALIFGLLADRYGRRRPLMVNLVFYSAVEVLSGLATDYTTFLILRALFGIGMGGEWGVGASLAMEKAPARWRGLLSGVLQEGYAVGYLLAACCSFFILPHWGWRAMFFIGGLPALLALFVRSKVKESAIWEKSRPENWETVQSRIIPHWKLFLYLTLLMMMMNFISHGTQDMYPTFLKEQRGFSDQRTAVTAIIYNLGALSGGIFFGAFSDRMGRRRSMIIALVMAVLLIPLWAFGPSGPLLVLGAFLMQFMVQGAWGVVPAHISELSPDSVRGFLPGFAYQCGVLLAGSVAWMESVFAKSLTYSTAMAMTALTVFVLGIVVIAAGKEKRASIFGGE